MTPLRTLPHIALAATAVAALTIPLSSGPYPSSAVAQTAVDETLASGRFSGADRSHRASGSARVVRLANGELEVRLEGFSVTGGPDLRVWVTDAPRIPNARAARRAAMPIWDGCGAAAAIKATGSRPTRSMASIARS
ncbi:DM13 domain-containing protein [Parasphingopyxis algicola]|uniref:DM13 domain-containing protein n=1 Tax=Parasphingopyxis algicola TaxID=2026624 RepID=UPI001FEA14C6|nr:DM13 domain-containing protein [Parasphingopyxis algicola]